MPAMYNVMVTGGIGSGKSTLRRMFTDKGAIELDLDVVSRNLLESDQEMVAELVDEFGEDILNEQGAVIPSQLAAKAFASEAATQSMNDITFPRITREVGKILTTVPCVPVTDAKVQVIEVPLLDQVPEIAELADEVIAVVAPEALRFQRAVERGMDPMDVLRRIALQATDEERMELADVICDNSGSTEDLQLWVDDWWDSEPWEL